MDPVIENIYLKERQAAYDHLYRQLINWRKEMWPDRSKDPIWVEENRKRVRIHLRHLHSIHPILTEYYGTWSVR